MTSESTRRARRSIITMSALVALFVVGTFVGFRLLFADAPSLADATTDDTAQCEDATIPAGGNLPSGQVTVTVYNAGSVSGLANRTLINLQQRGFRPGKVGNVPEGIQAANNITLITADREDPAVRLVARQFKGKITYVQPTQAQGDNVEMIVGPRYAGLRKKYPAQIQVDRAVQICVPVEATPDAP
ncbi:LytR C-terminal domain-containing protein [Solicola sp. PLA-1-18]|uniref:LytR C-terminal domain-containing protein n=1 Tax=Solicola sp. PLA-1-18 TaxID=3380532 RepID=UPI003B7D006B